MFPLQREQVHILTYSHSLFPVDHVPGEPTRPANHRWYSSSGGFVVQQHQEAAQHYTGHTNQDDQEHGGAQRAAAVHGRPSADSRRILLTIWTLGNVETPSFLLLKSVPQAGKNNIT